MLKISREILKASCLVHLGSGKLIRICTYAGLRNALAIVPAI